MRHLSGASRGAQRWVILARPTAAHGGTGRLYSPAAPHTTPTKATLLGSPSRETAAHINVTARPAVCYVNMRRERSADRQMAGPVLKCQQGHRTRQDDIKPETFPASRTGGSLSVFSSALRYMELIPCFISSSMLTAQELCRFQSGEANTEVIFIHHNGHGTTISAAIFTLFDSD